MAPIFRRLRRIKINNFMQPNKSNLDSDSKSKRTHLSPLTINRTFTNVTVRSQPKKKSGTGHRKSLSSTTVNDLENLAPKNAKSKVSYDDRFIPNPIKDFPSARAAVNGQFAAAEAFLDSQIANMRENAVDNFNALRAAVSDNNFEECRILAFGESAPKTSEAGTAQAVKFVRTTTNKPKWKLRRFVPTMPERVLDAPDLVNDYYLNILHWGSISGLAIGLGNAVFVLQTNTGKISKICAENTNACDLGDIGTEYVSSVQWAGTSSSTCLGVGYSSGRVRLFDVNTGKLLRTLFDSLDRIPALSWNESILSAGTRRGSIINYDVRVEKARMSILNAHAQEICGLAWSLDGSHLASGGNDNDVCVYDKMGAVSDGPLLHRFIGHRAAVKAVAWHPIQTNILTTGGGLADHTLNFWNVANGSHLNSLPTNSQVSGVVWNPRCDEFVTSHGHPQNQLTLWTYPSMEIGANLVSHTDRILGLTLSPDGTSVASIGADETVRIWKCFENKPKPVAAEEPTQKTQFMFN